MQQDVETSQFGITALGKYFVEAFAIELGFLGELRHTALGRRHVSEC